MGENRFLDRTAIVSGGTGGIGRRIAAQLVAEGALVHLVGRTLGSLRAAADRLGRSVTFSVTDIVEPRQVETMVQERVQAWGRIDVLMNATGILGPRSSFLDMSEGTWDLVVNANLKGAFLISQAVARTMLPRGGAIVHVSSIDALAADGPFANYSAAKAGVNALSRSMAVELGRYHIRVNTVCPGPTDTPLYHNDDARLASYVRHRFARAPLHRLVSSDEVASACVFLASDEASGITGTVLIVDSGITANWFINETIPMKAPR